MSISQRWRPRGHRPPESVDPRLHHQPTPESIARAKKRIGDSAVSVKTIAALNRARAADERRDTEACRKELSDARKFRDRGPPSEALFADAHRKVFSQCRGANDPALSRYRVAVVAQGQMQRAAKVRSAALSHRGLCLIGDC
jgi:hypothetical protein